MNLINAGITEEVIRGMVGDIRDALGHFSNSLEPSVKEKFFDAATRILHGDDLTTNQVNNIKQTVAKGMQILSTISIAGALGVGALGAFNDPDVVYSADSLKQAVLVGAGLCSYAIAHTLKSPLTNQRQLPDGIRELLASKDSTDDELAAAVMDLPPEDRDHVVNLTKVFIAKTANTTTMSNQAQNPPNRMRM